MKRVNINFKRAVNENKKFQKQAEKNIQSKFLESKEAFFNNFNEHPITQEINRGPSSTNISNTLNGVGNLFSFIGFYNNENPIRDLKSALEKNFLIKKKKIKDTIQYVINYPSLDKIKTETPMPWENGRSWVASIERGISGFSNYMYKKFAESRSGQGIQIKNKIRRNSYRPTRYMSDLINRFIKDMRS